MIFLRRTPAPVGLATTPTRLALDYRSEQEKPIFGRAPSLAPAVTSELSALRVSAAGDTGGPRAARGRRGSERVFSRCVAAADRPCLGARCDLPRLPPSRSREPDRQMAEPAHGRGRSAHLR